MTFDAGRFARQFGDDGHRLGYCLYHLGCKGPATYANCSVQHFNEVTDAWPIGLGHPCFGCTEQSLAFRVPLHETVDPNEILPPSLFPPIFTDRGPISPMATAVGGAVVGGAIAAGVMASKKVAENTVEAGEGGEG